MGKTGDRHYDKATRRYLKRVRTRYMFKDPVRRVRKPKDVKKSYRSGVLTLGTTVPQRMRVKLIFPFRILWNASATNYQSFRGNSIYDPDYTGVGGQPTGRDQWASLYQEYVVLGSKIKVIGSQMGVTGGNVGMLALVPSVYNSTLESNTPRVDASNPRAKFTYFTVNTGKGQSFMRAYQSTSGIFGVPGDAIVKDDGFAGAIGGNPTNEWYWTVKGSSLDGTTAMNMYLDCIITYYCEFRKPYTFAAS